MAGGGGRKRNSSQPQIGPARHPAGPTTAREVVQCRRRTAVLDEVATRPTPRTKPRDAGEAAICLGQGSRTAAAADKGKVTARVGTVAEGVGGLIPRRRRRSWCYDNPDSVRGGRVRSCSIGRDRGNDTRTNLLGTSTRNSLSAAKARKVKWEYIGEMWRGQEGEGGKGEE